MRIERGRLAFWLALMLLVLPFVRAETQISLPGQRSITRGGVYRVTGSLEGGQLLVDCGEDEAVVLILQGVQISSGESPAIEVKRAGQVRIILEAGTHSTLHAGEGARAALLSRADLAIEGTGALHLEAASGHGIHGRRAVSVSGGSTWIRAKKDGIKADGALEILGGEHRIIDCQEGLEGDTVLVAGGSLDITARDDGINASSADDIDLRQLPDPSGQNHWIRITGGAIVIAAQGDGMDANGDLEIQGGDIRISGPEHGQDGALDAYGDISISGGSLMAFGAAKEAQAVLDTGQSASLVILKHTLPGGQEISIKNQAGETLLAFTPLYAWDSAAISSPGIREGEPCTLWVAGQKLLKFVMGEGMGI